MMPAESAWLQGALRKAIAAVIAALLAFVLLVALLLTGFYLLVNAATLSLTPLLGEAGAMALTGGVCMLLLALVFYRLTRPVKTTRATDRSSGSSRSPADLLLDIVRKNPLEAASVAFALGVAEQGDPRLKSLLLQGGMVLMKQAEAEKPPSTSHPDSPSTSGS